MSLTRAIAALHNHEVERTVLGLVLLEPSYARQLDFPADAFTKPLYRAVYEAIRKLAKQGDPIEIVSVYHETRATFERAQAHEIAEILDDTSRAASFDFYVRRLKDLALRRDLLAIDRESSALVHDPDFEPLQVEQLRSAGLRSARMRWGMTPKVMRADVALDRLRDFHTRYDDRRVATGFPTIDNAIGTVHPGSVLTVVAKAGVGKSNLALNLIANWLEDERAPWGCVFYSLEMPDTLATQRLVQMLEPASKDELRSAMLSQGGRAPNYLALAQDRYAMVARGGLTMAGIEASYEEACAALDRPVRAVCIDYLQYIRPDEGRASRYEQVSNLTRDVKEFAKRRDVLVVLLSQVGRGEDGGSGYGAPTLSSARDSGTIEENADYVLGLWRPDRDPKWSDKPIEIRLRLQGRLLCEVLKGRNGGVGVRTMLDFNENNLRMYDAGTP